MDGTVEQDELRQLRAAAQMRASISERLNRVFAPEDDALRAALDAGRAAGMPRIQISPLQGRLLQVLAGACGARRILEIGSLAGYSGIWLARALPRGGRLISLERSEKHAQVARAALARAGLADRAEVRVGPALDTLPDVAREAPFDLIFIDGDRPHYPDYLDWALRLSRIGSLIVADNCVLRGLPLDEPVPEDAGVRGVAAYDQRASTDPRLRSIALAIDDDGTDGFAVSLVMAATGDAQGA